MVGRWASCGRAPVGRPRPETGSLGKNEVDSPLKTKHDVLSLSRTSCIGIASRTHPPEGQRGHLNSPETNRNEIITVQSYEEGLAIRREYSAMLT